VIQAEKARRHYLQSAPCDQLGGMTFKVEGEGFGGCGRLHDILPSPFVIQRVHFAATSKQPPRLQLRALIVENCGLDDEKEDDRRMRRP